MNASRDYYSGLDDDGRTRDTETKFCLRGFKCTAKVDGAVGRAGSTHAHAHTRVSEARVVRSQFSLQVRRCRALCLRRVCALVPVLGQTVAVRAWWTAQTTTVVGGHGKTPARLFGAILEKKKN